MIEKAATFFTIYLYLYRPMFCKIGSLRSNLTYICDYSELLRQLEYLQFTEAQRSALLIMR